MANPNENRIDTVIAPLDLTNINNGFTQINTGLNPYAQQLTEEERTSLFSIAEENEVFADDALQQGQLLLAQFPPTLQAVVNNMVDDTTLHGQLTTIENTQLAPLAQRVSDTRRLAAHERYTAAIAIYKYIEAGAALALPGFQAAYDILKVRFARQGNPQPTP
jgi:hypothetical protein